jgi:hypothetical protein
MVLLLVGFSFSASAQRDLYTDASLFLHNNNLDSAKALIEQAILDSDYVNEPDTWYLRGFIYKTIYNLNEKTNMQSPARMVALNSFKHSISIDTSASSVKETKKSIAYILTTFFNNAVLSLDSIVNRHDTTNFKLARENFEWYNQNIILIDSTVQKSEKMKFSKRIATAYESVYIWSQNDPRYFNLTKNAYLDVVKLDSNDFYANYNISTFLYNEAVRLIKQADYTIDLVALSFIQDNQIALFKASLPYMLKAYSINPKNPEVLKGLGGIYFSLGNQELSDYYIGELHKLENNNEKKEEHK